ncbi:methyltransferase [Microbacteriaceae bacterium VKM Ac-2854]|nr:methyltransferase [Microbacteriaceae bacterium VKM Ac-2854]
MREDVLERLRRRPDVEAADLVAVDAADRLLLDLAVGLDSGPVAVVGDAYGALTLGLETEREIAVYQDAISGERALDLNAALAPEVHFRHAETVGDAVAGAALVLLRLPRSLDLLDAYAAEIAATAPDAVLLAGGRIKHMSLSMNDVLRARYERLDVSLARQKSRVLTATGALTAQPPAPIADRADLAELGLTVCATPGAFAGAKLDVGTRFLLANLDAATLPGSRFVDLGCGTGVIAAWLAQRRPDARVIATDSSRAATASAVATAAANALHERIEVLRDDNASTLPDASVDVVVCNPPFHSDGAVTELVARRMIRAAARILRPGGEMWTVFNSHLSHPAVLRTAVGETRVVARDRKFSVTRSVRRSE